MKETNETEDTESSKIQKTPISAVPHRRSNGETPSEARFVFIPTHMKGFDVQKLPSKICSLCFFPGTKLLCAMHATNESILDIVEVSGTKSAANAIEAVLNGIDVLYSSSKRSIMSQ